jgi:hypothetical protein
MAIAFSGINFSTKWAYYAKRTAHYRGDTKAFFVDPLGLEPRMTEPKSAVLPITPWVYSISFSKSDAKLGNSKVLSNT